MPNSLLPFILTGIASVTALAQDGKPSREARAKERAEKLEQATTRLARLAEKYSQLSFLEPPVVEAKTHAEWRRMVEEEFLPGNIGDRNHADHGDDQNGQPVGGQPPDGH